MAFYRRRGGGGGLDPWTLLLGLGLVQRIADLPVKPPITLGMMAMLVFVFFFPHDARFIGIPSMIDEAAFVPLLIMRFGEVHRFWSSVLVHVSARHLFYNLSSFLYKGVLLETNLGSEKFGGLLVLTLFMTQTVFLCLSVICTRLGFGEFETTATVGFSGILFALKVLAGTQRGDRLMFLIPVQLHSPWNWIAEILVAQLMSPMSSMLGHLSGVIAGFLIREAFSGRLQDFLVGNGGDVTNWIRRVWAADQHGTFWGEGNGGGGGNSGRAGEDPAFPTRPAPSGMATVVPPPPLTEQFPTRRAPAPPSISTEEMRRRRLERFGG